MRPLGGHKVRRRRGDIDGIRRLEVVGQDRSVRLAYDGKNLEIMSPWPLHEGVGEFSGDLVSNAAVWTRRLIQRVRDKLVGRSL
jgi:hypothetical protein